MVILPNLVVVVVGLIEQILVEILEVPLFLVVLVGEVVVPHQMAVLIMREGLVVNGVGIVVGEVEL